MRATYSLVVRLAIAAPHVARDRLRNAAAARTRPTAASTPVRKPQCTDGIDNDGDGKTDYPNDPGCLNANQNDETDDCPDGAGCPECGNGRTTTATARSTTRTIPGCTSAAETTEQDVNPRACGAGIPTRRCPSNGIVAKRARSASGQSQHDLAACGGARPRDRVPARSRPRPTA